MSETPRLSPRQRAVGRLLAYGLTHKEIGDALGISTNTVKNHCTALYATTGVRDQREQMVVYWRRRERLAYERGKAGLPMTGGPREAARRAS